MVKKTFNAVFKVFQSGALIGCDPELAAILIRHMDDPQLMQAMTLCYDLYKDFLNKAINNRFWDELVEETGRLHELTGESETVEDILLYIVKYFEDAVKKGVSNE